MPEQRVGVMLRADEWLLITDALLEVVAASMVKADLFEEGEAESYRAHAEAAQALRLKLYGETGIGWFLREYQEATSRE